MALSPSHLFGSAIRRVCRVRAQLTWFDHVQFDARRHYEARSEQVPDLNTFYFGLKRSIGDNLDPAFSHGVIAGGDLAFLLVIDEQPYLAAFRPPMTEIQFLGDLRGGSYSERITPSNPTYMIEHEF